MAAEILMSHKNALGNRFEYNNEHFLVNKT